MCSNFYKYRWEKLNPCNIPSFFPGAYKFMILITRPDELASWRRHSFVKQFWNDISWQNNDKNEKLLINICDRIKQSETNHYQSHFYFQFFFCMVTNRYSFFQNNGRTGDHCHTNRKKAWKCSSTYTIDQQKNYTTKRFGKSQRYFTGTNRFIYHQR